VALGRLNQATHGLLGLPLVLTGVVIGLGVLAVSAAAAVRSMIALAASIQALTISAAGAGAGAGAAGFAGGAAGWVGRIAGLIKAPPAEGGTQHQVDFVNGFWRRIFGRNMPGYHGGGAGDGSGGSGADGEHVRLAARTASATENMAKTLEKMHSSMVGGGARARQGMLGFEYALYRASVTGVG
jgi:hypothetical protein